MPAFRRLRPEAHCKFKASMGHAVKFQASLGNSVRPCLIVIFNFQAKTHHHHPVP